MPEERILKEGGVAGVGLAPQNLSLGDPPFLES
jgi:hypothetical protein